MCSCGLIIVDSTLVGSLFIQSSQKYLIYIYNTEKNLCKPEKLVGNEVINNGT